MRGLVAAWLLGVVGCGAPEGEAPGWAVALTAAVQGPDDAQRVTDQLASHDRVGIAWGAFDAGEYGVTAAADELVALLSEGPMMRELALDALARLGTPVAATKLRALHDAALARHDEALAMTAMAVALRDPSTHHDLVTAGFDTALASLDDDWDPQALTRFRGYASALASFRDRGLTATLVGMLETDLSIEVVSPGLRAGRGSCGGCGGSYSMCTGGFVQANSPFPPSAAWRIAEADDGDCVVLLPGPTDTCLARTEGGAVIDSEEGDGTLDEDEAAGIADIDEEAYDEPVAIAEVIDDERRAACPQQDTAEGEDELEVQSSTRNDEILSYLSAMTGEPQRFDGVLSATHVWRGEAHYRNALEGLRDRLQGEHARLVRALDQVYLLPDGYQPPKLAVMASVSDDRGCGVSAPLPKR